MPWSLSIVVPAYNEAPRLGRSLGAIFAYLNDHAPDSEVIVVDDGSQDATPDIARESFSAAAGRISTRLIRVEPNRGKGYAVRAGLFAAHAPIVLFSDADLSTPITETPKLIAPIRAGEADLVIGSRALDRRLIGVHQPWQREQGGRFFNLVVRLATGLKFWDTQCGFKAFRMDLFRPIVEAATIDRFGFDVELLYVAHLAGLRIQERAVRWDHNEGSKLDPVRDSLRAFGEIRLIRQQARRGVYDQAITAVRRARENTQPADGASTAESDVSPELASSAQRI